MLRWIGGKTVQDRTINVCVFNKLEVASAAQNNAELVQMVWTCTMETMIWPARRTGEVIGVS